MNKLHEKYLNDPTFHMLVNSMEQLLENVQVTPTEIREAAMMAAIRHAYSNPQYIVVHPDFLNLYGVKYEQT